MIVSILYILLAILGISFLIFIHELGHYFMARRLGMRVETFSIGFGKPLYVWERDGERWQIGWLPFGGYVKIAGMEGKDSRDMYDVQDGFFGKSPWDRIKVAFMGPFVNIVFALLAFAILWTLGGRDKKFYEYTHKIGWLDPKSELYIKGIRPGDEITSYGTQKVQSAKDHVYGPTMSPGEVDVHGYQVDMYTKAKKPFNYKVKPYSNPLAKDKEILTVGVLNPANYVIYDRLPDGKDNPLPEASPMKDSGIQYGDRIVWVDGLPIYSLTQLNHVLNDSKALLTIRRGQEILLRRVPRVPAEELKLDAEFREELIDWQFEAGLNGIKIQKLYTLPYNLNNEGTVEEQVKFIDKDKEEENFSKHLFSDLEAPLQSGDQIIAVDGIPVNRSYEILQHLQEHHVNIIVERDPALKDHKPVWTDVDEIFDEQYSWKDLYALTSQIGLDAARKTAGNLVLLEPIVPKMRNELLNPETQALMATELQAQRKEVENIADPEKRAQALRQLDSFDRQLMLGLPAVQDQTIQYNPDPFTLFKSVLAEIWHTLQGLFTGSLSPSWMSGPIGVVRVMYDSSMVSLKEALFWLGAISLNLGVLNLLPLPVLDGGTILFSLYEIISGKRLQAKTMEKLIIPFALLLIGLFIFFTYNDLSHLFGGFFK